jgi:transposase
VERAINKLKQFRAVATRCDKRSHVFLGTVTAASLNIRVAGQTPPPDP